MPVFLQGRRAFLSSLRRRHRRGQPLSSPPFHRFGPCLPAPRLFVPRLFVPRLPTPYLPRCRRLSLLPFLVYPAAATCHSYPHLVYPAAACHSYPHLVYPAAADFGYRSAARHAPLPLGPNSRTIRAPSPILPKVPPRPASLLLFCPGPPSRRPRHKKRRTEPHRGPSAAKKQPICRGSITAAGHLALRKIAFSESRYPDTWEYQVITSSEEDSFSI